jgi:hypothetical protein
VKFRKQAKLDYERDDFSRLNCDVKSLTYTDKEGTVMTMQSILAALIGGWELVLILAVLLIFAVGAAAAIGIVFLIVRATQKKTTAPPPQPPPPIQPGSS